MTTLEGSTTSPMVEMDAREFGLHLKEGGWRLGLLVVRSVEPGEGSGVNRDDRRTLEDGAKVSAKRFADMAGTSDNRVMRYYRAWERYAAKGKVPPAAELQPGDEPDLNWEHLPRWSLSEIPSEHGATGQLNMIIKLGQFGDRLLRSHKRFITFVQKDLPEYSHKPDNLTKELASDYADCLETDARLLRAIASGKDLPEPEVLREELDPSKFFRTA